MPINCSLVTPYSFVTASSNRAKLALGPVGLMSFSVVRAATVGISHNSASEASEPLFPDSVEAMRLVRSFKEAFGLNQDELYTVCTKNPAKVVGLELQ